MSDIATVTGTCYPFDWALAGTGETLTRYHYYSPAQGVTVRAEATTEADLQRDNTLHTAVILSLFSDRRADTGQALPYGQTARRGWCGESTMLEIDQSWGSHLWLAYISKTTAERREFMQFAASESLAWMKAAGIVDRLEVGADWLDAQRLGLTVQLYKAADLPPAYDRVWSLTVGDANA